mmetsp:Transcript_33729/g.111558  ORF Transcript_33729/g.111558 Transcript_33729/m.111558 type:complete len:227 (+) Transcript_33729:1067-1747(+)
MRRSAHRLSTATTRAGRRQTSSSRRPSRGRTARRAAEGRRPCSRTYATRTPRDASRRAASECAAAPSLAAARELLLDHPIRHGAGGPGAHLGRKRVGPEHEVRDVPLSIVVHAVHVYARVRLPLSPPPVGEPHHRARVVEGVEQRVAKPGRQAARRRGEGRREGSPAAHVCRRLAARQQRARRLLGAVHEPRGGVEVADHPAHKVARRKVPAEAHRRTRRTVRRDN